MTKIILAWMLVTGAFRNSPSVARGVILFSAPAAPQETLPPELQQFLAALEQSINAAINSGDPSALATQLKATEIPEYTTWFPMTFGPEEGAKLSARYPDYTKKDEESLLHRIIENTDPGVTVSSSLALPSPRPDQKESEFDSALRGALKQPAVFYLVQFNGKTTKEGVSFTAPLGYFTLVDGRYRRLSPNFLRALPGMPAMRIRQGGKVQSAKLVNKVQPAYPVEARKQRASGTVRLHVILATNGSVKSLEVVSGDPLLVQSAVDAVRQWTYQPTLLNGEPVEVDTTVDVIFSLNY